MSEIKAYLMGRDGKLEAWRTGQLFSFRGGYRVVDGRIHLRDGDHKVDPRFFFRVGYEPWWVRAVPIILGFLGLFVGALGGIIVMIGGAFGGVVFGILFNLLHPIEKEIFAQWWEEGDATPKDRLPDTQPEPTNPIDVRHTGGVPVVSAQELQYVGMKTDLAMLRGTAPPMLWVILALLGGVVIGAIIGKA